MRTERLIVSFGIAAALLSASVAVVAQDREGAAKPAAAARPWAPAHLLGPVTSAAIRERLIGAGRRDALCSPEWARSPWSSRRPWTAGPARTR